MSSKDFRNREAIGAICIILATLAQMIHGHASDQVSAAKNELLDQAVAVATANSALAANSSEIILQRDLMEVCIANGIEDKCGSSKFLLQSAAEIRDGVRASISTAIDEYAATQKKFQSTENIYGFIANIALALFYIFMFIAFFATRKNWQAIKS
jgi:hypothetical protein